MNLMYVAVICALIGLVFAFVLTKRVNSVDAGTDRMKEIASAIAEGARAFLFAEYRILAIFIVVLFVVLCFLRNHLQQFASFAVLFFLSSPVIVV